MEVPKFPLMGLGTDVSLSELQSGKFGLVLANGTVAVGSAADEAGAGAATTTEAVRRATCRNRRS